MTAPLKRPRPLSSARVAVTVALAAMVASSAQRTRT